MADTSKMTNAEQLRMLALRAKGFTDAQIAHLAALMVGGYGRRIAITLPASGWSGRAQTVENEFFQADNAYQYFVGGDADCLKDYNELGIRADNITVNGKLTFHCEITPDVDLIAIVLRLEVEDETDAGKESESANE